MSYEPRISEVYPHNVYTNWEQYLKDYPGQLFGGDGEQEEQEEDLQATECEEEEEEKYYNPKGKFTHMMVFFLSLPVSGS